MTTMSMHLSLPAGVRAQTSARPAGSRRQPCFQALAQPCRSSRQRSPLATRRMVVVAAGLVAPSATTPHLQLATAKLPAGVNTQVFNDKLYQWAATLTSSGRNLPFALPLKADKLPDGFQISLLRVGDGGRVRSVADLVGCVEQVAGTGNVLMVRLYEGEGSSILLSKEMWGSSDSQQRLQLLLKACVDVPTIMQTMPNAIQQAVVMAR